MNGVLQSLAVASIGILYAVSSASAVCRNGAYISSDWIQTSKSADQIDALATRLESANIRDYFVPINGYRNEHRERLKFFLTYLRARDPTIQVFAMLGRRVCTKLKANCVDIGDPRSRIEIAVKARDLWNVGFDGVQLDLEPIPSGSMEFEDVLDRVREAKPQGRSLSLAGYLLELEPGNSLAINPQPRSDATILKWSRNYYRSLVNRVDHVMVMNYDTALRSGREYRAFTAWQTREIRALSEAKSVRLQIGLPSAVSGRTGLFDRSAENIEFGSLGITDAIDGKGRDCPSDFGVAVFTEGGLTPALLESFVRSWGNPSVVRNTSK